MPSGEAAFASLTGTPPGIDRYVAKVYVPRQGRRAWFHIPYAVSTAFFAVVLTAVFVLWYRSERTLSIHSIRTPRREMFYWATVLAVPGPAL